jgi:hypothetical protein
VVDGTHLYFNDPNDPTVNGSFDTTPNVDCGLAAREDGQTTGDFIDTIICPVLALVFPPEGDVFLPSIGKVWDCPPYDLGRPIDGAAVVVKAPPVMFVDS